jgi:hypothetical protein
MCPMVSMVLEIQQVKCFICSSAWDGIFGHQYEKRLESFDPCNSQSLLLADFTQNHALRWFKNLPKNPKNKKN